MKPKTIVATLAMLAFLTAPAASASDEPTEPNAIVCNVDPENRECLFPCVDGFTLTVAAVGTGQIQGTCYDLEDNVIAFAECDNVSALSPCTDFDAIDGTGIGVCTIQGTTAQGYCFVQPLAIGPQ